MTILKFSKEDRVGLERELSKVFSILETVPDADQKINLLKRSVRDPKIAAEVALTLARRSFCADGGNASHPARDFAICAYSLGSKRDARRTLEIFRDYYGSEGTSIDSANYRWYNQILANLN